MYQTAKGAQQAVGGRKSLLPVAGVAVETGGRVTVVTVARHLFSFANTRATNEQNKNESENENENENKTLVGW